MANSGIHVFQSLAISPTEDSKCGLIFLHFYLVRFIVKTHVTLSPWSFLLLREEIFADWLCISKGEKIIVSPMQARMRISNFNPFSSSCVMFAVQVEKRPCQSVCLSVSTPSTFVAVKAVVRSRVRMKV